MTAFHIRRATLADAGEILNCLSEAFAPYRDAYTPGGFADTVLNPQTIADRLAVMTILVAFDDSNRCVGTIGYGDDRTGEGHLRGMAVLPSWHGRGVANALLATAEKALAERGCDRITLDTTRPLQRAISFYESHGYRPTGVVRDFFGMELLEYVKRIPIVWRVHVAAPRPAVYDLLATAHGRASFWAESAEERNGLISFVFSDGTRYESDILEQREPELFSIEYFASVVVFRLEADGDDTVVILENDGVDSAERTQVTAGWVSVLMQLKAAAQFGIDLRNHSAERSWARGYVEN